RAAQCATSARSAAERLAVKEPSDERFQYRLAMALRILADLKRASVTDDALTTVERALEIGDRLIAKPDARLERRAERAEAAIGAGRIAAARGDMPKAQQYWRQGSDLLTPYLTSTNDWRVLQPAARLAVLLGRDDAARNLITRLDHFGYQPAEPWPDAS